MLSKPQKNINICGWSDILLYSTETISKINQKINDLLINCNFAFCDLATLTREMISELPFFQKYHLFSWQIFTWVTAPFRGWNFQQRAPIKGKMVNKQGDFSPCAPFKSETTAKNLSF